MMITSQTTKILIGLLLIVAILFGINRYNEAQRDAGRHACEATVATATAKAVSEALEAERKDAAVVQSINAKFTKDIKDENVKKDAAIADLRSGNLRLRDKYGTCSSERPEATTSASGDSQAAGCQLSRETAEFLVGEASRADEVVLQLKAAQELLIEDRKLINGRNP